MTDDSTFNFFPQDCPNAYARQLTRAAYLPDCRAYELVSPGNASAVELYPGDVTEDLVFYQLRGDYHPALQDRSPEPRHGEEPLPVLLLGPERSAARDESPELPARHLHLDPDHQRLGDAGTGDCAATKPLVASGVEMRSRDGYLHRLQNAARCSAPPKRTSWRLARSVRLGFGRQQPRSLADEPQRRQRRRRNTSATTGRRPTSPTTCSPR